MREVEAIVPAGKTPMTDAVEQAADVLDYRAKPGVIVVVTDGEETCGGSPCALAAQLRENAAQLTVHVIGFRYQNFSWTGGQALLDLKCLADQNSGLYIRANTEDDLVKALQKTLNCPMLTQAPTFSPIRR
jgi:Ca-activated chloride channel family protein